MRSAMLVLAAAVALSLAGPAPAAGQGNSGKAGTPAAEKNKRQRPAAQNQGQKQSQPKAQGQGQKVVEARGRANEQRGAPGAQRGTPGAQGRGGPTARAERARRGGPAPNRAAFNRGLVDRALRVRGSRNGSASGVEVRREGGEVRFLRADGNVLFSLDEARANELGYWRVGRVPSVNQVRPGDRDRTSDRGDRNDRDRRDGSIFGDNRGAEPGAGTPAFCRSGEGHPVWGRAWCVDKGFGLGNGGSLWGWGRDIEDVVLRRPDYDRDLDRGGLADVLGDVVFGRIAVQSLVLGAEEPLTGRWMGQRDGPRVLRIHAGDLPVAELVDTNRDNEVDVLMFNLGG